jgi:hypothetical protein
MIGAVLLLTPGIAAAHDEPVQKPEPHEAAKEEAEKEEAEPPWEVFADFVGGATTTEVLTAGRPTRVEQPPANVFDSTRVTAYTFLFGLERHLGERFTVGARMPIITADLTSRTGVAESRSATLAGNLELEGAFLIAHGATWDFEGTLEVALPTAGGTAPPSPAEVAAEPEKVFAYRSYDFFAAAHAASAVRGTYESALFEPGYFGLVPKLSANFRFSKLTVTPMVKVENLFDVTGKAEAVTINELVAGVRAGYRVVPAVEPGVHVWVRELHEHSHASDSNSAVGVVEPYVRFHQGGIKPFVSVILPFAGDLADDKTFGVRAGFVGEF